MQSLRPIIIITGATATGKTRTSINLAQWLSSIGKKCEVVNFDSLLFYKELNIGTAKPTIEEIRDIKHSLISINSIKDPINAADFNKLCIEKIDQLHSEKIIPILTGGSAFYLRAIIKGMYDSVSTSSEVKGQVESLYKNHGISIIREKLKEVDIHSYSNLHENDHYRNIRALEHFLTTGSPLSNEKNKKEIESPYDFSITQNKDWKICNIYLEVPKEEHWPIMEARAKQMISDGLIEEVQNLLTNGYDGTEKPLSSIGYKETISYIKGGIKTEQELLEKIYIATRRLAKSQKTFFNKIVPKSTFHPLQNTQEINAKVKVFLDSFC